MQGSTPNTKRLSLRQQPPAEVHAVDLTSGEARQLGGSSSSRQDIPPKQRAGFSALTDEQSRF